jgi:hypothetical protein
MMQVMPNDSVDFKYVIYPLQVGFCKLPSFHVKLNNYTFTSAIANSPADSSSGTESNTVFDSVINNMLPSQLFVFPEKVDEKSLVKH